MLISLKGHLFISLIKVEIVQRGVKNDIYRASGRGVAGRFSMWRIRRTVWGSHESCRGLLTINWMITMKCGRLDISMQVV